MDKKKFVLDGHNMKTEDEFYDELQRVLCPGFKHFGRNWNAVNDILRGGFGMYELGEEILLVFKYKKWVEKHLNPNYITQLKKCVSSVPNVEIIFTNNA